MAQQRKKPNLSTERVVDEARVHALRQYNDTDGHFSFVRFVDNNSRDPRHTSPGVFANERWLRTEISILQTS